MVSFDLKDNPKELTLFAEDLISTPLYERDFAVSPDGNEVLFTRGTYTQKIRALVSISSEGATWGEAQILPFSGKYQDIEPFYAPDGSKLYFASNRPIYNDTTRSDYNIWAVERKENGWGVPFHLDSIINTKNDEFYPAVSSNGNLYFTATRTDGIGREDIFLSEYASGQYQTPTPLDSTVNSTLYEFNAYVNPDESFIIFSSFGREDGYGGGDLYFSEKSAHGSWTPAQNMGPELNSEFLDFCPFVDQKHGNLYFSSDRTDQIPVSVESAQDILNEANKTLNGMGNIYRINLSNTPLKSLQ
ncbi:exo-alpha-sialidase [Muriicola soli]|uniref:Exo-alpha-sialidase n=2 Tax=Muriicola soli TaxID=2507538 RepID=A0A411ECN1_9FLAO|nr:exo-alpha-sialidase [Muriicola soli]